MIAKVGSAFKSILLVDDEVKIRKMIGKVRANGKYSVCTAGLESAALEIVGPGGIPRIDLLLTDVMIPEMDAIELTAKITRANRGIEVRYMSNYPVDATLNEAVLTGRVNSISKPFSTNDLMQEIHKVIGGVGDNYAS